MPYRSTEFWLKGESGDQLQCVGVAKANAANQNLTLGECGSSSRWDVFVNLPATYKGDDLLRQENFASSLAFVGQNPSTGAWNTVSFDGASGLINTTLPGVFFSNRSLWQGATADHPTDAINSNWMNFENLMQQASTNGGQEANVSIRLFDEGYRGEYSTSNRRAKTFDYNKCKIPVIGATATGVGNAKFQCLDWVNIFTRDAQLNVNKTGGRLESHRKTRVRLHNCASGFVYRDTPNCSEGFTERALADQRVQLTHAGPNNTTAKTVVSSVAQLRTEGDSEMCLRYTASGSGYSLQSSHCNSMRSEASSHFVIEAITDENFYENMEITDITTVNLEDFNSFLVLKLNSNYCLRSQGNQISVVSKSSNLCTAYRVAGKKIFMPTQASATNTELGSAEFDLQKCYGGVSLPRGTNTVHIDCWDYVPRRLKLLAKLGDIISMIPLIGIIPGAVMNGIVCNSNESSLNQEACTNLYMGVGIDVVLAPFDIMTAGVILSSVRTVGLKMALRAGMRSAVRELGEEAAQTVSERAIREVTEEIAEKAAKEASENAVRSGQSMFRNTADDIPNVVDNALGGAATQALRKSLDGATETAKLIGKSSSKIDSAASDLKNIMKRLYAVEKNVSGEKFVEHFDNYFKGYFGSKGAYDAQRPTAMEAVQRAFILDKNIDPQMAKSLRSELIPELFGNAAVWAF